MKKSKDNSLDANDTITVILADGGANKIAVIKEVRGITELGLKEAKDLVTEAPKTVKTGVSRIEAYAIKKRLEEAGGKVVLIDNTGNHDVILVDAGGDKIRLSKSIREITGCNKKKALDFLKNLPKIVKTNVPKDEAENIKKIIEIAGGKAEIVYKDIVEFGDNNDTAEFDVILMAGGDNMESVTNEIRGIRGLELKRAMELVEETPSSIITGVSLDDAIEISKKILIAGGTVKILPTDCQFDVILADGGVNKIAVIKEVRIITGLGLKEAKDLVTEAPTPVKTGVCKDEAREIKKRLEEAGAKVDIKTDLPKLQMTNGFAKDGVFDVILANGGANKIAVIKEVRIITGLGLKEAKDLVTEAPKTVKVGVSKDEANEIKKKLEEAGATIEIRTESIGLHAIAFGEEKAKYDVIFCKNKNKYLKNNLYKAIHSITGLERKAVEQFVRDAPKPLKTGVLEEEAYEIKKKIEDAEGLVEIRPESSKSLMVNNEDGAAAPAEEEQTEFDVILVNPYSRGIPTIKEIRSITGLGLRETMDLVREAPKPIKTGVSIDEAYEIKKKLEEVGWIVEIRPEPPESIKWHGMTAPAVEEKTEFDVILADGGANKIAVIKEVRGITGLGLKEARDIQTEVPRPIKTGVSKDEAIEIKKKLEAAGAKVEIK